MHPFALLVVLAWHGAPAAQQADPVDCAPWQTCRQLAADAAGRGDVEAFHTIAWRAVQTGPRHDPDLMYLLARAQSLSGRAHDALVMLRRLAERGVARTEVETLDDFRRVRNLPEWPATLELIRNAAARPTGPVVSVASSKTTKPPSAAAETAPAKSAAGIPLPDAVGKPVAMAYDAVSARLVIADESSGTLKVVSESSSATVADLVSRGWAGAYQTTAIAIDGRRGDLWVVGADASTGRLESAIHRVQLISGRLRYHVPAPEDAGPVRFTTVALSGNSAFVLDTAGRRIFELAQGGKTLRLRMTITAVPAVELLSLAVAGEDVAFVSHAGGIVRLDLVRNQSAAVAVPKGVDVQGLQWMQHDEGSLLGIQRRPDGTLAAVRIRLESAGRRVRSLELVGPAASHVAAVMNGTFYYVEDRQGSRVVRPVSLR